MQKPKADRYCYKPGMETAKPLHKLYDSEHVDVPGVEDIILNQIKISKGFNEFLKDFIDKDSADADLMELCMLIDVDLEDVEPIDFETGGFNV